MNDTESNDCPFCKIPCGNEWCVYISNSKKRVGMSMNDKIFPKYEQIENAVEIALHFATTDISGGCEYQDPFIYFKDKNGNTSFIIHKESYTKLVDKMENT